MFIKLNLYELYGAKIRTLVDSETVFFAVTAVLKVKLFNFDVNITVVIPCRDPPITRRIPEKEIEDKIRLKGD